MLLCTEYEAFLKFKEDNPDIKVGSSKFTEHKPRNVVLPGSSGTHSVCVCTYHQNPKLMLANSLITSKQEFKKIVGNNEGDKFSGQLTYNHLLAKIMCNPPSIDCSLGDCKECGNTSDLETLLLEIFDNLNINEITYIQWETTDRTTLTTKV